VLSLLAIYVPIGIPPLSGVGLVKVLHQ
jgi:hypothetical protein